MSRRLNICLLDKFTSQGSLPSCFLPLLLAQKERFVPRWGIRGLEAKEEHEPWDSHGVPGCRIQAPSHLIPSAALPP